MKLNRLSYWILLFCSIQFSCKTMAPSQAPLETVHLDTIDIRKNPALEIYRSSIEKKFDLIHTTLELSFDWDSSFAFGTANILLSPHFYPQNRLVLDAKGMQIKSVKLKDSLQQKKTIPFTYNDTLLDIDLQQYYTAKDSLEVEVEYIAMPNKIPSGNGTAIRDNIGMYFINPDGADTSKPKQIWTQGEPTSNSCWFPTLDAPNQKMTQEFHLRVDSTFSTLSNGKLLFQIENGDGTRTDYWMQDQPHAPYLAMIAIGEYAIVKDEWKEKEVAYYVEKDYEEFARAIFPNTVEMLDYFSSILDYEYPWDKYNQVIVRDYVSGAMENTSAVIYGEFMQGDGHYLVDNAQEEIVAHELFHHWFGDLVTCESWSNLPLNESFATYGEVLWMEHKYGQDAADYHRHNDFEAYRYEARLAKEKMIRFYYEQPDDMFDAHSYQKGGCILHMLRAEIGDEAFFLGLNLYLKKFANKSAEIHNLRLTFEEITGRDLNWFFNQWFFEKGHPEINFSYKYAEENQSLSVEIEQTQNGLDVPQAFKFSSKLEIIYADGSKVWKDIFVKDRNTRMEIPLKRKPEMVRLDASNQLLAEINQSLNPSEAWALFQFGEDYLDRRTALKYAENNGDSLSLEVMLAALDDPFWRIRESAFYHLQKLAFDQAELSKKKCLEARKDENAQVRAAAFSSLAEIFDDKKLIDSIIIGLNDTSYEVRAACLNAVYQLDPDMGFELAQNKRSSKSNAVQLEVSSILSASPSDEFLEYFMKQLIEMPDDYAYTFILNFGEYLMLQDASVQKDALEALNNKLAKSEAWWIRLGLVNVMVDLKRMANKKINSTDGVGLLANEELLVRAIDQYLKEWRPHETEENVLSLIKSGLAE